MGVLSDYALKRFGVRTKTTEKVVACVGDPVRTLVLENNPDRLEAIIINYDGVLMRIAPSVLVSDVRGIPLDPTGGFTVLQADYDGELVGYEWYAYTAGGGNLYVIETEAS